jgi:hypothetical protein
MWHIMQFIDGVALGDWPDFEREWCIALGNGRYRIKDPKALGTYLREQYAMFRRLKADVGQQLPRVSRVVEHVDYDAKSVAAVEDLARPWRSRRRPPASSSAATPPASWTS